MSARTSVLRHYVPLCRRRRNAAPFANFRIWARSAEESGGGQWQSVVATFCAPEPAIGVWASDTALPTARLASCAAPDATEGIAHCSAASLLLGSTATAAASVEPEEGTNVMVTAASTAKQGIILMQTAQVQASGETKTKTVRVMLDSGSNQSFIRAQVARDLGCRILSSEPLRVETFGGAVAAPRILSRSGRAFRGPPSKGAFQQVGPPNLLKTTLN